jgi:hypothetical protein
MVDHVRSHEIDPDEIGQKPAPVISMLGTFGFRSGNLRFAPIFCSSNLRFHYRAISLRSMFREGGK